MQQKGYTDVYDVYVDFIAAMDSVVKSNNKCLIVWEGFHGDGSAKIKVPKDVTVMEFEDLYNLPDTLVKYGYTIINACWTPLYTITWRNEQNFPSSTVYDWNLFSFGSYSTDYSKTTWRTIAPTPLVIGAQFCSWEQAESAEIPSFRKKVPAMSERICNPDAGKTYADFERRFAVTDSVLTKLLQLPQTQTQLPHFAGGTKQPYTIRLERGGAIRIGGPAAENVTVDMFDPAGHCYRTLYRGVMSAPAILVGMSGQPLPAGLYLFRIRGCRSAEIVRAFSVRR